MPPTWQDLISMQLGIGRDRAVSIGQIAENAGISRRVVEKAIELARHEGQPILSCSEGVYVSWDADEIAACADALEARLVAQYATVKALRATARRHERVQQMEMFG